MWQLLPDSLWTNTSPKRLNHQTLSPVDNRALLRPSSSDTAFCCHVLNANSARSHTLGISCLKGGFRVAHPHRTETIQQAQWGRYWRNLVFASVWIVQFPGKLSLTAQGNEEMAFYSQTCMYARTHPHTHILGQIIIKEPVGYLIKWTAAIMLSIQPLHFAGNCKPGANHKYH